jgi:hypothetical protein
VLAAIFKAVLTRLFVGSRPFPMILSPLIRLSGQSRSQETKWSSVSHFAHIPSGFAEDGYRSHDIDAIDPGQVRTGHAKQPGTQLEPRLIAILLLATSLPLFLWQTGTLAPILSLLEILLEPLIALGHLLLATLVTILFQL